MIERHPNNGSVELALEETSQDRSAIPGLVLIEALTKLAHHKRLILTVTGASILVGVAYSLALPVMFTANTKILTPQQTQSSAALLMSQLATSGTGSLAAVASGGLGLRSPNDMYIGLLTSRPVADAIIAKFRLLNEYHAKDMTIARSELTRRTKVVSEKSGLLTISVTDRDKLRAAELANSYTDELRRLTNSLAVTEAAQRRLFYEEQVKRAKDDLVIAELSFQRVQQSKGLVQLDAQAKAVIESLAAIHAQVSAKQVELQALRSYSTDLNPSVQLAQNELSALQEEALRLEKRNGASGSATIGLQDVAGIGLEYLRAQHELQYRQLMFDLLVKQLDAAKLDESKDAAVIQVVEPAIPPDYKSSPHRSLIVLAFTVIGCLLACTHLLARYYAQTSPEISHSLARFRSAVFSR